MLHQWPDSLGVSRMCNSHHYCERGASFCDNFVSEDHNQPLSQEPGPHGGYTVDSEAGYEISILRIALVINILTFAIPIGDAASETAAMLESFPGSAADSIDFRTVSTFQDY